MAKPIATAAPDPNDDDLRRRLAQVEARLQALSTFVQRMYPHLYKAPGAAGGGTTTGAIFAVALTQTGGSNGDHKTTASYTYTAVDGDGTTVGTGLSPEFPRNYGKVVAATRGLAYDAGGGSVVLAIADEKPQTNGDYFYVALTQTGGANGSKTAAPSYTYTAVDSDGVTMGTGLSPAVRLINKGTVTAATKGLMYQSGGSVTLVLACEEYHAT